MSLTRVYLLDRCQGGAVFHHSDPRLANVQEPVARHQAPSAPRCGGDQDAGATHWRRQPGEGSSSVAT